MSLGLIYLSQQYCLYDFVEEKLATKQYDRPQQFLFKIYYVINFLNKVLRFDTRISFMQDC